MLSNEESKAKVWSFLPEKTAITRRDPFTGKINTMHIRVSAAQMEAWYTGMLIQEAMPQLSPDEREFIKTGITKESWDGMTQGITPNDDNTDASQ